ncbi:MAG: hypothetical protein ACRECP_01870 [Methylocella sp.]
MQLNDWQKAVARIYGDGDFAHFEVDGKICDADLDQCGDTLFVFLMLELSDTEDCDSPEEAIRRIEIARRQLGDVIDALEVLSPAAT